MNLTSRLTAIAIVAAFSSPVLAVSIELPATADAEVGERPGDDRGNGAGENLNTRFFAVNDGEADRNEIIALKFDLSTIDLPLVSSATLNLTHFRDNSSQRGYIVYGVNDGAMGGDNNGATPGYDDNTWEELSVVMSTMPGLIYDGSSETQGINDTDTTVLGMGSFVDAVTGTVDELTAPGLLGFLSSHPDDIVTILVAREPLSTSTGQDRFASREATALSDNTPGSFAPYLSLTMVPEPSSALLALVVGAIGFVTRRR